MARSFDQNFEYGAEVSHTDHEGYTITIKAVNSPDEPGMDRGQGMQAWGRKYITSPDGETVQSGLWLDWPEPGWVVNGVDLDADYWKNAKTPKKIKYFKLPTRQRMKLECIEQATKWGLKKNFEFHKKWHETHSVKEFRQFVRACLNENSKYNSSS